MGGFLVVIVTLLLAVWVAMVPLRSERLVDDVSVSRPSAQAVAGNMIEVHQAAVDFVSQTVNKAPASNTWSFTLTSQASVRCPPSYTSGAYPTNSVGGTCTAPATEFRPPEFAAQTSTTAIYNWNIYYRVGTPNIVVTYATAGALPGGYSASQIAAALDSYNLKATKTSWYWGVTPASAPYTLSNGSSTLTLPSGFSSASTVGIATIIY